MESVEAEGRTVAEATERALAELDRRRDEVDLEVLSEGRPRLLGFRGEPARVRATPIAAPEPAPTIAAAVDEDEYEDEEEGEEEEYEDEDEDKVGDEDEDKVGDEDEDEVGQAVALPTELLPPDVGADAPEFDPDAPDLATAVTTLEELLRLMSIEAAVTARGPETAGDGVGLIEAVLDVDGDDLGILIGRRGGTLASLQYVLNLIVSKKAQRRVAFGIDVDGYKRRREDTLVSLARRMASRVRGTGRSVTLEPMPPNERRIVHLTLANDPAVMTVSIGDGEERKVAITPSQ